MNSLTRHYYRVAEHVFSLELPDGWQECLSNYTPFETDEPEGSCMFIITFREGPLHAAEGWENVYTDVSDDEARQAVIQKLQGLKQKLLGIVAELDSSTSSSSNVI